MFVKLSLAAKSYNVAVIGAGGGLLLYLLATSDPLAVPSWAGATSLRPPLVGLLPVIFFAAMTLVAAWLPVRLPSGFTLTAIPAPLFGAILTLDNPAAVGLLACFATIDARQVRGELPAFKVLFNRGLMTLAYTIPALLFHPLRMSVGGLWAGLMCAILIYAINLGLMLFAVSLVMGVPMRRVYTLNSMADMAFNWAGFLLMGVLIRILFEAPQPGNYLFVVVLYLPLMLVRNNIVQFFRLREQSYATTLALANALDARDRNTAGHSLRVAARSEAIATQMKLSFDLIEVIRTAAAMHDVGKIGVRDSVLFKQDKLTAEEWEEMKSHAMRGGEILRHQKSLWSHAEIVEQHHERHDGSGYPRGIAGTDIEIGARVIAVADSYDAMTSPRPYRPRPLTPGEALYEINQASGGLYHPDVVRAFTETCAAEGVAATEPALDVRRIARQPAALAGAVLAHPVPGARVAETGGEGGSGQRLIADPDFSFVSAGNGTALAVATRPAPARLPALLRPLSQPAYLLFWTGQSLSYLGDMVHTAALMLLMYQVTHGLAPVAGVLIARSLPQLLFGLHAGAFADRFDRKTTMVISDLARAAMVASIPALVALHLILPWIFPVMFAMSMATVMFNPARAAVMPELVRDGDLLAANSLLTSSERFVEVFGYALGGLLVVSVGYSMPFYLDALTFLGSGLLISFMTIPRVTSTPGRLRTMWGDVGEGLALCRRDTRIAGTVLVAFLAVVPGSMTLPLLVFLAQDTLSRGAAGYVVFEMAIALGLALGATQVARLSRAGTGILMSTGLALTGMLLVAVAGSGSYPLSVSLLFISAVFQVQYAIANVTSLQRLAPAAFRGRVFGLRQSVVQLGTVIGLLLATLGVLLPVPRAELAPVLLLVSGLSLVALGALTFIWPAFRRIP
ncbi:MAG: MFS transporter [Candidatus Dormibacteria bacterium]